ncbi:MAG: hypothetical protein KC502_16280 [Myxococcales bacterium]|nr:hypothetical protein [Myxococcales bacterium]
MFVSFRGSTAKLLIWQWKASLSYVALGAVAIAADQYAHLAWLKMSTLPLAVIGGAVGIFVSFRTNSGYDRWWEGRKLWGRMVNTSRHFTTQTVMYIERSASGPAFASVAVALVMRQAAYVHALRCLLRSQDPFEDERFSACLPDADLDTLRGESNLTHALLQRQADIVADLGQRGVIDPFQLQSFDNSIRHLLDIQGGCERIKNTPFPPSYGFLATRLTQAYAVLLPLGIVDDLGWLALPITWLVCMGFTVMAEVGRTLETPFSMYWPALPLQNLSTTIEVNLRQRIGDTNLPTIPQPDKRGVLM